MKELFVIIFIGCLLQISVSNRRATDYTETSGQVTLLSYKQDVLPIVNLRCAICHNESVPERNWKDYKTTYNKRREIKLRLQNRSMPVGITMTEEERRLMISWVDQGAKP